MNDPTQQKDIITVTDKDGWSSFMLANVGTDFIVRAVHYDDAHQYIEKVKICEFDGLNIINEHEETREELISNLRAGKTYKTAHRIVFGHLYPWKDIVIEKAEDGTEQIVVSQKGDDLNFSIPQTEINENVEEVIVTEPGERDLI